MVLKFYDNEPPAPLGAMRLGGVCPHCKTGSRYSTLAHPQVTTLREHNASKFVATYICELCSGSIPIEWEIWNWSNNQPIVGSPRPVLASREEFDFGHVPDTVRREIEEGLDCLSVSAFHGFAALCRRAIQAICTDLGAESSTRVKKQIVEMCKLTDLPEELKEMAIQIMLSGHDGSHPHLPPMDSGRAEILLSMLRDLTHELYTRPGNIKEAAQLRSERVNREA